MTDNNNGLDHDWWFLGQNRTASDYLYSAITQSIQARYLGFSKHRKSSHQQKHHSEHHDRTAKGAPNPLRYLSEASIRFATLLSFLHPSFSFPNFAKPFDLELQTNIDALQKLQSQQQENKGVQRVCSPLSKSTTFKKKVLMRSDKKKPSLQEFAELASDANIYKLIGPVLSKQDRSEAVLAVDGRLEFIEKEMFVLQSFMHVWLGNWRGRANQCCLTMCARRKRVEKQIKQLQEKSESTKMEVSRWTAILLLLRSTLEHLGLS